MTKKTKKKPVSAVEALVESTEANRKALQLVGAAFQLIGATKISGYESKAVSDVLEFLQGAHDALTLAVSAAEKKTQDEIDRELLRKADAICNNGNAIQVEATTRG